jgi:peptidoglycan hydrolase-like protein with peptidoglycan-binding domain
MGERVAMLPAGTKFVKRVLHKGMSGEDVKYVQELMDELNDFYKFCPNRTDLKTSGFYGPETARFVTYFQIWMDLVMDGYFDKNTSEKAEQKWQDMIRLRSRKWYETYEDYCMDQY